MTDIEQQLNQDVIVGWQFPEFEKHSRTRVWYIVLGVALLFILGYAVWTQDYLVALLSILVALVMLVNDIREPHDLFFGVTESGVIIGNKQIPHGEIERFWFASNKDGDVTLFLDFNNMARPRITIPTDKDQLEDLAEILSIFVEYDGEAARMPLTETMGRWLKM